MKRLRIATRNPGKLKEFREVLSPLGFEVIGIEDLPDLEIIESGESFSENSEIKARKVYDATGEPTLADDSGLVVKALGGAPGIHSARYNQEPADDQDGANRQKLIREMSAISDAERDAYFICSLAWVRDAGSPIFFEGRLHGKIGFEDRGHNGFGYDPLFIVKDDGRTTAEMSSKEKNKISHRGRALEEVVAYLSEERSSESGS